MEFLVDLWKIGGPRLVILALVAYGLVQASKHLGTFLEIEKERASKPPPDSDESTLEMPRPKPRAKGEKRVLKR